MKKLKLLLLIDEMEVGGTQRQIVYLAKHINRDIFEPTVLYFRNKSYLVSELDDCGVRVKCVNKKMRIDPIFFAKLESELWKERYHVLHCFSFSGELWGALANFMRARSTRSVLVTSVRNVYDWYSRYQWLLKKWVSGRSFQVVANSKEGAQFAETQMNLAPGSIRVVYNGVEFRHEVPIGKREIIRSALGIENDILMGLFVGRFVEQKNIIFLLQGIRELANRRKDIVFYFAGDGPLRSSIETTITRLSLNNNVRLLGAHDDIPKLLDAADFITLPSIREGMSNVILEAMAAGKPVIASRVGGTPELIAHNENGMLFPCDDIKALNGCLLKICEDRKLRIVLGENARYRARNDFSIVKMVQSMESIYLSGIEMAKSGSSPT